MTEREIRDALTSITVSVPVVARVLGISRSLAYRAAKSGEIECITVGRSIRVPTAPLRKKLGFEDARAA